MLVDEDQNNQLVHLKKVDRSTFDLDTVSIQRDLQ